MRGGEPREPAVVELAPAPDVGPTPARRSPRRLGPAAGWVALAALVGLVGVGLASIGGPTTAAPSTTTSGGATSTSPRAAPRPVAPAAPQPAERPVVDPTSTERLLVLTETGRLVRLGLANRAVEELGGTYRGSSGLLETTVGLLRVGRGLELWPWDGLESGEGNAIPVSGTWAVALDDRSAVWVVEDPVSDIGTRATLVQLPMGEVVTSVVLPPLIRPIGAFGDRLVLDAAHVLLAVDPTGTVRRLDAAGLAVAADGGVLVRLLCDESFACSLVGTDVDGAERFRWPAPSGLADLGARTFGLGRMDPTGSRLALVTLMLSGQSVPGRSPHLLVVDLTTGQVVTAPVLPDRMFPTLPMAWTADGNWLFYPEGDDIVAWQPSLGQQDTPFGGAGPSHLRFRGVGPLVGLAIGP